MTETPDNLLGIISPEIISIMLTIKQMQKRMKEPDMVNLEYVRVYDQLSREFDDFFTRQTNIFVSVIRGEDFKTLSSVLFYKDKQLRGLVTEEELSKGLAEKYLPPDLKAISDANIKEMKERGESI